MRWWRCNAIWSLLQAQEVELLAALDAGDRSRDGFTRDAVAAALRVPPASMKSRMSDARDLAERLPDTLALLRAGEITQRHALDLADAVSSLTRRIGRGGRSHCATAGAGADPGPVPRRGPPGGAKVTSPAEEEKAHQQAVGERRVVLIPADCGMAWVSCYLSADCAATVLAAVDAVAYETIHGVVVTPGPRTSAAPTRSWRWRARCWPTRTSPARTGSDPRSR